MASAEQLKRKVTLPSGETKWVPTGKWRGVYRDAGGVKQHTKAPYYTRKKDAKAAANAKEVEARRKASRERGDLLPNIKWGAWWDTIADERAAEHAGDAASVELSRVRSVIRPRWGDTELNRIKRGDVQKWVDVLAAKYSASYVHNCYITFRVSMNKAADDGGPLDASPCVNIKLPPIPKVKRSYLEVSEAPQIGVHMPKGHGDSVELGLETGMRPSELAGLHVNRLRLKAGWLEVREVYVRRRKTIKPLPKNGKPREVALTPRAIEIIERNLQGRELTGGCGYPHDDGTKCDSVLVLVNSKGRAVCPEQLRQRMITGCKKGGVSRKSPYAARRGYSTRLAEGGLDPWEHARQMGHATLEQTMDYNQVTARARGRILAALGNTEPLTVVEGGKKSGTLPGTNPDSQALPEAARNA